MDINALTTVAGASAFQQGKTATAVEYSVAAKVLDSQKTQGADALQLLQAASQQPSSSNGVDTYA